MIPDDRYQVDADYSSSRFSAVARGFVIIAYGLFSISAQALIFREFITSFEANDITIGIFFAFWFLWVAIGSLLVNKSKYIADLLLANIELVLLAYLPAFIFQAILIIQIRTIAGIAPYALLPIPTALFLGVLVNAPVSFLTGLLFPLICRWVRLGTALAVSRVYLLESAGSFLGGLGTMFLLAFGVSSVRIFFILAFILSLAVVCSLLRRPRCFSAVIRRFVAVVVMFLFGIVLVLNADKGLSDYINRVKWSKLLPPDALAGSFHTAQAEYLYGTYQNQWVAMRQGSVVEAIPDPTSGGKVAAISLSQNPRASRVLVIGSGLNVCNQLLHLPQVKRLVWANPDNEYVEEVLKYMPSELRICDARFEGFSGEVRSMLGEQKGRFDLVIVNMLAPTDSVSNRFFTVEFFEQVKKSLGPDGVFAIRIPGGENILGTELVTIGASAKLTLGQVFEHLVLVPGDDGWFIASDANNVTSSPGVLRQRFAAIENAEEVYPSAGILSIYLPDRAAAANEAYSTVDLPAEHLINRDSRPLAGLYGLLLAARQSDAPVTQLFKHLLLAGLPLFLVPILIYVVLRFVFLLSYSGIDKPGAFDYAFLVFSSGAVGIGVVIVLMYLYQTLFGSLYLHIGAVSSLYMAGLAGGAAVSNRILQRTAARPLGFLLAILIAHCAVLAAIVYWPAYGWSHMAFGVCFVMSGLCAGCYFPLAGRLLADSGLQTTQVGAKLETADHLGAAAGGLLCALILIPVLGAKSALFVFILLLLANVPAAALRIYRPAAASSSIVTVYRTAGYILFGVAAVIIVCSNLIVIAGLRLIPALPQQAAQALAGVLRIETTKATLPNTGKVASYFKVYDANDKLAGYIFSSEYFAPGVRGFGGKINLAVYADTQGRLVNFYIIRSNETPAYLDMLVDWLASLKGHFLFQPSAFEDVEAVTGATVSSEAIIESLQRSGGAFATDILGRTGEQKTGDSARFMRWVPDMQGWFLLVVFGLTIVVIYSGGFWSRLFILVLNVVVAGILLNAQFSTQQVASLLLLAVPSFAIKGVFILTVGAPLLAVLFGNIYCGYLCPFGAFQEVLGYVLPARFRPCVSSEQMRRARFIKYIVLFVIIAAFFLSRSFDTLAGDPLIRIFSPGFLLGNYDKLFWVIIVITFIGSLFYSRFWCRYLCPAGAFLSLFNKLAIFSRFLPPKHYAHCEYGVSYKDRGDCIYCDKCRFERKPAPPAVDEPFGGFGSRGLIVLVLVVAVSISIISAGGVIRELPSGAGAAEIMPSAGQPRNVDLQKVRGLIRGNKLSDREAEYYKKLNPASVSDANN